jgi:hypothetical protein
MTEEQILGFKPDFNRSADSDPSKCRIASIVLNEATILPDDANPRWMEFHDNEIQFLSDNPSCG